MILYIPVGKYSFSILKYQNIIDDLNASKLFAIVDKRRKSYSTKIRINFSSFISFFVKLVVVKENNQSVIKCYANIFKLVALVLIAAGLASYLFVSIYDINYIITMLLFIPITSYALISFILSVRNKTKKRLFKVIQ